MGGVGGLGGAGGERVGEKAGVTGKAEKRHRKREEGLRSVADGGSTSKPPPPPVPYYYRQRYWRRFKSKDLHTDPEHPQVREGWMNKWVVPKCHLLRESMRYLTSYVGFLLIEGPPTMIEIIISLWEHGERLVNCSATPNHARELVPEHLGYYGMDTYKSKVHDFLESKLLDDSVLGLWGPSGVGKTRFLHLMIACYSNGDSLFHHIIPIQIGAVREMHRSVAMILKLDWASMSLLEDHERAKTISKYLKHKRFLVLLDGVEDNNLDLASFGLPMRLGRGQKVILTSRSQSACTHMGCTLSNIIEMKCLGEEDAWNLFKYKAKVEITKADVKVHKIAKQMLSACGGLPRAICAVGVGAGRATFCGTDPNDWRIAYEQFKVKAKNLPPERMEKVWAVQV